jgi:hypothetical protein
MKKIFVYLLGAAAVSAQEVTDTPAPIQGALL